MLLAVAAGWRRGGPRRRAAAIGVVGLGAGWINAIQYARQALFEAPDWPGLPIVQKLATALLLTWIAVSAVLAMRRPNGPASTR